MQRSEIVARVVPNSTEKRGRQISETTKISSLSIDHHSFIFADNAILEAQGWGLVEIPVQEYGGQRGEGTYIMVVC